MPSFGSQGGRSDSLDSTGPWQIDGPEVAQILRFDWEKGAWVPDVIEVLPPELGETDDLSQGLKALIGVSAARHIAYCCFFGGPRCHVAMSMLCPCHLGSFPTAEPVGCLQAWAACQAAMRRTLGFSARRRGPRLASNASQYSSHIDLCNFICHNCALQIPDVFWLSFGVAGWSDHRGRSPAIAARAGPSDRRKGRRGRESRGSKG